MQMEMDSALNSTPQTPPLAPAPCCESRDRPVEEVWIREGNPIKLLPSDHQEKKPRKQMEMEEEFEVERDLRV